MDASFYQLDMLKTLNEKLKNSDRINRSFLKISGHAYCYYNYNTDCFETAGDWFGLCGLQIRYLSDLDLLADYIAEGDSDTLTSILNAEKSGEEMVLGTVELREGSTYLEMIAYVNYSLTGAPIEKYILIQDISRVSKQKKELEYLAYFDTLTGICNRNFFVKKLQEYIDKASLMNTSVSLAMLDIDGFKRVNDSIGLILGDELIQDVGLFLKEFENENIIVGRFGADVFNIAIFDPCGTNTMEHIFSRLSRRLKRPFILSNGDEITISMSCGVADYPEGGDSSFVIIKNAEIAMFKAKETNRGGIAFFDNDMLDDFLKTISLEHKLKDAIDTQSFVLYYQPQFDSMSGILRGAEALIRWIDYDGTVISPGEFIPVAEKSGAIISIGNWVLKEAISTLASWKRQFNFDGVISVNLSALQLKKDDLDQRILSLLKEYSVEPKNLELEITESVFIDDYKEVIDKLRTIKNAGIRISLDDFGTGFSSLSYLRELPIDTLKIDKSFVDSLTNDETTGIITESIIRMVKQLGMKTVAEGVENESQYEWLRNIKCDTIQGYLLGKPMPAADFEALLYKNLSNELEIQEAHSDRKRTFIIPAEFPDDF